MDEIRIQRINELARKSKTPSGLTEQEKAEQKILRQEYIASYKRNMFLILKAFILLMKTEISIKWRKRNNAKAYNNRRA